MKNHIRISLRELLRDMNYDVLKGSDAIAVKAVCYDTRDMMADSVFVCIRGNNSDGHSLVGEAIYKGAIAVIAEKDIEVTGAVTVIRVEDTRKALALVSASYFGFPANDMLLIGITGTKGKTTTAYMIYDILTAAGYSTGIIGSIEVRYGNVITHNENTTPESYVINKTLCNMRNAGVNAVVMEVSSQALKYNRVYGMEFDYGVFTNISEDHIGPAEHSSMEEYVKCKSELFGMCRTAVFNMDDEYADYMIDRSAAIRKCGYGIDNGDVRATDVENVSVDGVPGISYNLMMTGQRWQDCESIKHEIILPVPGRYSVYNSLAAIAVTNMILELDEPDTRYELMAQVLNEFSVAGRMEVMKSGTGYTVVVDYAHNAMSLMQLLKSLREYTDGMLICIFGCGGNRSKSRRYNMGEVSAVYADVTVITDDNPRYEAPEEIMADIEIGILKVLDIGSKRDFSGELVKGSYIIQGDRQKAIQNVLSKAKKNDMIVIAGKGHETYQEIKGVRYPMSDSEVVREVLRVE